MKYKLLKASLLPTAIFSLLSFDLPEGWIKAGSKPKSYEMAIAIGQAQDGKNAATIKSVDKKIDGFGTLMQQCKPDKYLGKRIKMTAYVRSEKVSDWAGLWLRVDQSGSQQSLSFDNMQDRAIKGTTDWAKYEIVLDVPINASMLAYGTLLSGEGQVWFDKFSFEIVGDTVKPTGSINGGRSKIQSQPTNLDFEK
jgi:hypothetical protein